MRRVFSGIQPTGRLHLGNYLGAIRNWVKLQNDMAAGAAAVAGAGASATHAPAAASTRDQVLFSIVDLHAMTNSFTAAGLRAGGVEMAAALLACGLQPEAKGPGGRGGEKCTLYLQSAVREHTELAWLLSCITPLGWLQRMTQFKDKEAARARAAKAQAREAGQERPVAGAPLGLLSYPVLQAADILLYKATHVPVGEDQAQHLELSRDIAAAFHTVFCPPGNDPVFPLPQTLLLPTGARVMSLRDGSKKMSKSDPADDSRINLGDSADVIAAKIKAARTDSGPGFTYDPAGRPDKSNLLSIYAAVAGEGVEEVAARFSSSSAAAFKAALTDLLVAHLVPIGQDMARRLADPAHLHAVLEEGGERARAIAAATMGEVRSLTGYR